MRLHHSIPSQPLRRRSAVHRRTTAIGSVVALLGLVGALGAAHGRTPAIAQDDAPLTARADAACRTTNPLVAVVVQPRGTSLEAHNAAPVIVAVRRPDEGSAVVEPIVLARQGQVGAVYGLAYDAATHSLFAAAHHRNGAPFGPGGPGAIYRIDLASGEVAPWRSLDAGPDRHLPALSLQPGSEDDRAAAYVGKTSLGDIDLSGDGASVHVVNLFDRYIYTLALSDGATTARLRDLDPPGPYDSSMRPFGLGVSGDEVLYGVVDTREADRPWRLPSARIYAARPDGTGRRTVGALDSVLTDENNWTAWNGTLNFSGNEPLLADIAVRPDASLLAGLRDRTVDANPRQWANTTSMGRPLSVGSLYRMRRLGPSWRSFAGDRIDTRGPLDGQAAFGSAALLPGLDVIVAATTALTGTSALDRSEVGLTWIDVASGAILGALPVARRGDDIAMRFELALGDVTVLCSPRPPGDVDIPATASAVAAPMASATALVGQTATVEAHIRTATAGPNQRSATQTAHAPTELARATHAHATATAMAPTVAALATAWPAVATALAGTATAATSRLATAAPARAALLTLTPLATRDAARREDVAVARAIVRASDGSDNPYLATTMFIPIVDGSGRPHSRARIDAQPVVIAFNDSEPEDPSSHLALAWHDEVGSVYGLAVDVPRQHVYAAAYNKRLTEFGPLGPGGVYRIDLTAGTVEPFALLEAGVDAHGSGPMDGQDDRAGRLVGLMGLGDIELAPDRDELFVVNLFDQLIYRFRVPDGRFLGAFPHGAAVERWSAGARPFGLGWRDGHLYHGLIDDDGAPPTAHVYRSLPDGSDTVEVTRLPLDYPRYFRWSSTAVRAMLADLTFRNDGDLVIGLRDRLSDSEIGRVGNGDIVLTARVGDRFIPLPVPELYDDQIIHDESSFGALASLPWLDQVATNAVDPQTVGSNGAVWFDNATGHWLRRETIYAETILRGDTFAKAAGLGDMESLNVAPTPTHTPTATGGVTQSTTSTPSPPPTRTPLPTITPTPTTGHYEIYLPVSHRQHCVPFETRTDVVLVLDMSTSMYRLTRGNRTKHHAAVDAAQTFVSLMRFALDSNGRRDRVGVVGFNNDAWVGTHLTSDRAIIDAALDGLAAGIKEGTRIDLAIQQGQAVLEATPRASGVDPVLILLTDGLPNRVPTPIAGGSQEDTVLAAATAAKTAGTRLFAVGLGETGDVFESLLAGAASGPGDFFMAPDGEDLAGIYRGIAGRLTGCP